MFAGLFFALFISLLKIKLYFNRDLDNNVKTSNNFLFIFFYLIHLNIFTSAIGKDLIQFSLCEHFTYYSKIQF